MKKGIKINGNGAVSFSERKSVPSLYFIEFLRALKKFYKQNGHKRTMRQH